MWSRSPSTTNAFERLNVECKSKMPVALQHTLSNVYKLDKSICAKYLAGLKECSISYREKSESARRSSAIMRQQQRIASSCNLPTDPAAVHGPPDRVCHFNTVHSGQKNDTAVKRKSAINHDLDVVTSKNKGKHLLHKYMIAIKLGVNIVGNVIPILHQLHYIKLQMEICWEESCR